MSSRENICAQSSNNVFAGGWSRALIVELKTARRLRGVTHAGYATSERVLGVPAHVIAIERK